MKSQDIYDNILDDEPGNWGGKTSFISLMQFYEDKKESHCSSAMKFEDSDIAAAMNYTEYVMTQERAESSFERKINTFEDSRSLKISEDTFMKMIRPYD